MSSYSSFVAASQSVADSSQAQPDAHVLSYGVMGSISSVPAGFAMETIVYSSASGVSAAMLGWGDVLLKEYGKQRYAYRDDLTMQRLGYSTDNGAFYCCCTPYVAAAARSTACVRPPPMNKTYEDTLVAVKAYSTAQRLPYAYILLDSWWYYKSSEDFKVDLWDARPSVFPHGLVAFSHTTDWPLQLHCGQMWTPTTRYSTQNGGAYKFIHDGSPVVVPEEQRFWDDLLANKTSAAARLRGYANQRVQIKARSPRLRSSMITYEMDWMNDQFTMSKAMLSNISIGRRWLMQADAAAIKSNVSIQICMALVRQTMQSVEMKSVTNARASNDYHPGNTQWSIVGTTSILLHAIGVAPSKDNFWSTTGVQSGSHWGGGVREPHSELQSAV